MRLLRQVYTKAAALLLRPYTRREMPGWGLLYRHFVGAAEKDHLWVDEKPRWIRGKMHRYEMLLRINGWSNRATFFLGRFYDLPTQLLIQQVLRRGDTFVDVGANEGMMTLLAAQIVGSEGQVIAFEPNPVPREILLENLRRNRIDHVLVHAAGLSDSAGTLLLTVPLTNSGEGSFTKLEVPATTVACPVHVGDDLLRGLHPQLLKIDVEGFETRVLKGLADTIVHARPLISIEMIAGHLKRDQSTPDLVSELLQGWGYTGRRLALRKSGGTHRLVLQALGPQWADGDYVWGPVDTIVELERDLLARAA